MNKKEIKKILAFTEEVKLLPDELLTEEDIALFLSESEKETNRKIIYEKENNLFEKVKDLKIRLLAYFRVVTGEESTYIDILLKITFQPKGCVYNTIHFQNNKAWIQDKIALLNLLKMAKSEFEEKIRFRKQNPENSLHHFLKSKETKAILLGALLAFLTAIITKDIWWNKLFSKKPDSKKNEMIQSDTIVSSNKQKASPKTSFPFH